MYYTYIIQNKNNENYIGSTRDLVARLKKHNTGKVTATKAERPWKIVYYEAHLTYTLARKAEIFYKSSQGRRQIKKKLGQ